MIQMAAGHFSENNGMVIAMVGAMLLSCGVVLMLIFTIVRNARRGNREVDDLLDELNESEANEERVSVTKDTEERREPWERKADWWK